MNRSPSPRSSSPNRSSSPDLDRQRRLSGVLESLSSNVRKRVELLREVHAQRGEVEAKLKEGIAALEAKYQKLYQPLYTKRYEIVNGISEDNGEAEMEKGIPGFWLFVLKNHHDLFDLIRRRDGDALKCLKDIKWSTIDEPRGFKLEFFFGANPYFKNSVLTKTYHMVVGDGAVPERAIGTEIDWYPGKSLTQKILKKKKNPMTVPKNEEPMDKPDPCRSFFNFFNPPHFPLYKHESDEDEYDEDRIYDCDIDEDDIDEAFEELEDDYKIGSTIRDNIIPKAVSWFTTEMDEEYIGMLDVDEFYYDDEDVDDDEEEDDDNDDDEMERQRKRHMPFW